MREVREAACRTVFVEHRYKKRISRSKLFIGGDSVVHLTFHSTMRTDVIGGGVLREENRAQYQSIFLFPQSALVIGGNSGKIREKP